MPRREWRPVPPAKRAPPRGGETEAKSPAVLRGVIGPDANASNVLLFDDLKHVLTEELGPQRGIQVPPYSHFTPINTLATLLEVQGTPMHAEASRNGKQDMRNYLHTPPDYRAYMKEALGFLEIVKAFLGFLDFSSPQNVKMIGGAVPSLAPAPLSSVNAIATWPGGIGDPRALLYSTDTQVQFKASGGRRKATRKTRKARKARKGSRKARKMTRRH